MSFVLLLNIYDKGFIRCNLYQHTYVLGAKMSP